MYRLNKCSDMQIKEKCRTCLHLVLILHSYHMRKLQCKCSCAEAKETNFPHTAFIQEIKERVCSLFSGKLYSTMANVAVAGSWKATQRQDFMAVKQVGVWAQQKDMSGVKASCAKGKTLHTFMILSGEKIVILNTDH